MTFAVIIAAVLFGPALLIMAFALGYKLKRLWGHPSTSVENRDATAITAIRRAISIPFMLVGLVFALLAGLFYLIDDLIIGEGEQ